MSDQLRREAPARTGGLDTFVQRYGPDDDVVRPGDDFLGYAGRLVPDALLGLWEQHGIGFYGDQRLALVDPGEWMHVLQTWLGDDVESFPIVVTSFGHVYHLAPDGRVHCLDPHFQSNTVVADDVEEFFDEHLPGSTSHIADLEGPRGGARQKLGPLQDGQIYSFDPILALGGTVSPNSLVLRDGPQHLLEIHREVIGD